MGEKNISRLFQHYEEIIRGVLERALLSITLHQQTLRSNFDLQVINLYI